MFNNAVACGWYSNTYKKLPNIFNYFLYLNKKTYIFNEFFLMSQGVGLFIYYFLIDNLKHQRKRLIF